MSEEIIINQEEQAEASETALLQQANEIVKVAESFVVTTDADYQGAGEYLRAIKQQQKRVSDFFEPFRSTAYAHYKTINDRKKESLAPLDAAEKIIRSKMGEYAKKKEDEQRVYEERRRAVAAKRLEQAMKDAEEAEAAGDAVGAEFARTEIEVMKDIVNGAPVKVKVEEAEGVSRARRWEICKINEAEVPVVFDGVVIRPVDTSAIMQIIKSKKGDVVIPGVKFEETVSHRIRT